MSRLDEYRLDSILISEKEIEERVSALASDITSYLKGESAVFVCILKGASIFTADLVRALGNNVDVRMDFMAVSSYGDSDSTSGAVKIIKDTDTMIEGKNVMIVEDIMDTGLTLHYLQKILNERKPKSMKTCVLLEKPDRRKVDCAIDHVGFSIPDKFVVGYGLDYAGKWRHLKDIWTLTKC